MALSSEAGPRRIGLFGGAFDPPHRAHVALAMAAVGQVPLDRLAICPTGQAWHKARGLTDAVHRLAMARIAFAAVPNALVDDRELRRDGPTYTIDTLRELQAEHPGSALFLLMGEDQAASFTSWRDWESIAALATICVAMRRPPGHEAQPLALPDGVRSLRIALPLMPDSATEVRLRLTRGQDIAELVAPGVASYIEDHRLYSTH